MADDQPITVDAMPALMLRYELQRARLRGLAFDAVWPGAVERATERYLRREREEWEGIFAGQRDVWHAAYERREVPDVLCLARAL